MPAGQNGESPLVFIYRVRDALMRVVALAVFGLAHWLLGKGVEIICPPNMTGATLLLLDISYVAFCGVYVYLLWDMIAVFIPALHSMRLYTAPEVKSDAE